jgi:hypothetical protein
MGEMLHRADFRANQYGIRTQAIVAGARIKFEIVLEGRIELAVPGDSDRICGVSTLTPLDMAASKLLANADRWRDDGVFSRDIFDLERIRPDQPHDAGRIAAGTALRLLAVPPVRLVSAPCSVGNPTRPR